MSIFLKKIEEINFDDIETFIQQKHPENIRLEYKEDFSSKDDIKQIAKEVSALANQQGGVILFGIRENGKTRQPDSIIGIDIKSKPRERIQSVCIDHIYPPIFPQIQECNLKSDPGKVVTLVRVDMSAETPHTINNRTGFYIRGEDICVARPMTDEEIELLWDRRKKLEERREWLLRRSYNRVFAVDKTKESLENPIIFMAIPLYPMKPLVDKESLLDIHNDAKVLPTQDFLLYTRNIKTASDSIYSYLPFKRDRMESVKDIAKSCYGELNIFGQVYYIENAVISWSNRTGIFLYEVIKQIYFFIRYTANFYKRLGYWGIVKVIIRLENCVGAKILPLSNTPHLDEELCEIEVDKDIEVEKEFTVTEVVERTDNIASYFLKELLWGSGLDMHRTSQVQTKAMIQYIKMEIFGKKECPECKRPMPGIDTTCIDCKNKGADS